MKMMKENKMNRFKLKILNNLWKKNHKNLTKKKSKRNRLKTENNMKEHMEDRIINLKIIILYMIKISMIKKIWVKVNKMRKDLDKDKKVPENLFTLSENNSCKKSWKSKINQKVMKSFIKTLMLEFSKKTIKKSTKTTTWMLKISNMLWHKNKIRKWQPIWEWWILRKRKINKKKKKIKKIEKEMQKKSNKKSYNNKSLNKLKIKRKNFLKKTLKTINLLNKIKLKQKNQRNKNKWNNKWTIWRKSKDNQQNLKKTDKKLLIWLINMKSL